MESLFIIGAYNTGLVAIVGFAVKRWMDKVDARLDSITSEMRIANGRTGKIEGKLDTQIAVCDERHDR